MIPLGWRLSAAQWEVLTEALQLDGYPVPIQVRPHGHSDVERGRARAELRRLGLLRAGRVDADLEAALHLLHRPARWLDSVWFPDAAAEQPVRVLAAQGGTVGVCALQHPDRPAATDLDFIPGGGAGRGGGEPAPAAPAGPPSHGEHRAGTEPVPPRAVPWGSADISVARVRQRRTRQRRRDRDPGPAPRARRADRR